MKTKTITLDQFITGNYSMEQELHTIQLTRRELGLIKHYSRLLFTNIDDVEEEVFADTQLSLEGVLS